jgi:hypothetical protein
MKDKRIEIMIAVLKMGRKEIRWLRDLCNFYLEEIKIKE